VIAWLSKLFKSNSDLGNFDVGVGLLEASAEPDHPLAFGYKVGWFAVATEDAALVARVLGLVGVQVANWQTGLKMAVKIDPFSRNLDRKVFLTPPLNGWVLVVGGALPYPTELSDTDANFNAITNRFDNLMLRLSSHFPEVQYSASHRVSDFVTWTRRTERLYRSFTYADGWVYLNRGSQTKEERALGMPGLTGMGQQAATDEIFRLLEKQQAEEDALCNLDLSRKEAIQCLRRSPMPSEKNVTELAGLWSLDPSQIEERFHDPSTGLLGELRFDH